MSRLVSWRQRNGRALARIALFASPLVLAGLAYAYVTTLMNIRERAAIELELLTRDQQIVAESPHYPGLIEQSDSLLRDLADEMFGGPDERAATAALANYIARDARATRVMILQNDIHEPALVSPGVLQLQIRIRGLSDLQGLLEFLQALEGGTHQIRVAEISIQHAESPLGEAPDEEVLSFAALVSGFALVDRNDLQSASPTTIGGNS